MKQLAEIIDFYDHHSPEKSELAFALLFKAEGSSYRKTGARMLIDVSGNYAGGISGGCLEEDIRKKARVCVQLNKSEIVPYNTSKKNNSPGSNLGCDGKLEILVHPLKAASPFSPVAAIKSILYSRKIETIYTIVRSFASEFDDMVGNAYTNRNLDDLIKAHTEISELKFLSPQIIDGKKHHYFVLENKFEILCEFIDPIIQLILVGSQRDIIPMTTIAQVLGWKIIICGREQEILSNVEYITAEQLSAKGMDEHTAIVFMSHDFDADIKNLPGAIDSKAFYTGILGPEKRKRKILEALNRIDLIDKIAGPIGINIGSKSPEEIALATCAEIKLKYAVRTTPEETLQCNVSSGVDVTTKKQFFHDITK